MCINPQGNITTEEDTALVSENKTQSSHNYTDSVMKQVDSMTSRLAPDDFGASVKMKTVVECHKKDTILYTIITTTLVNIVVFIAFSLICRSKKPEVKEDILIKEELENFKPILKESDCRSPYECI